MLGESIGGESGRAVPRLARVQGVGGLGSALPCRLKERRLHRPRQKLDGKMMELDNANSAFGRSYPDRSLLWAGRRSCF